MHDEYLHRSARHTARQDLALRAANAPVHRAIAYSTISVQFASRTRWVADARRQVDIARGPMDGGALIGLVAQSLEVDVHPCRGC